MEDTGRKMFPQWFDYQKLIEEIDEGIEETRKLREVYRTHPFLGRTKLTRRNASSKTKSPYVKVEIPGPMKVEKLQVVQSRF
jgi:hypothetical protein